jgi:hypothetical protein
MLQIQSKNMVTIVVYFSTTSDIQNTFLVSKVEINNHRLNKVKISNLKTTKDVRVIIKNEFKIRIRSILDLWLKILSPTMWSLVSILITYDLVCEVHASHV